MTDTDEGRWDGSEALEAWRFVGTMLDEMTAMVTADAETELELLEGLRALGRITALCSELSLDADPELPRFFSMNTDARLVGGPNPDGEYHLAMVDGRRRYRVRGRRGTVCYLGLQVLAGTGSSPRRMAAHVSDRDLDVAADGTFELVLATAAPTAAELAGARWVHIPEDASGIVVRQYVADRATETLADLSIEPVDPPGSPALPTDGAIALQLTAMAWTIAKLATLHRSVLPELLERPNELVTAEAQALGGENTTPDNLYMLGSFRLDAGESLVLTFEPPATRYWSINLETVWHECIDVRRRRSSLTNAGARPEPDGSIRVVVSGCDPGHPNWLDTGGRHRGFVTFRWLDHPVAPEVVATVTKAAS